MATENILQDFFQDIANAIRNKKGISSDTKLKPEDFAEEIKTIQSKPSLFTPSITVNQITSGLNITDDNGDFVQQYDLYIDDALHSHTTNRNVILKDKNIDLLQDFTAKVKAKSTDFSSSKVSNVVNFIPATNYVSLGDSIAAGHFINGDWETNYGERSQYGVNGNSYTVIVEGCYTNLIQNELKNTYGGNNVTVTSFARTGDKVSDLIEKLSHEKVKTAIKNANIATISIGANDALMPATAYFSSYLMDDDGNDGKNIENTINSEVQASLSKLASGSNSFPVLFNTLITENPNAKYIFTTIYNPYKYLHLDEGSDGFFKPLLDTLSYSGLPSWALNILVNGLLSTTIFERLFSRVNNIHNLAEGWVTSFNDLLKEQVGAYNNPNIFIAETKALFDTYPDRGGGDVTYDMLVSQEFTRGFKLSEADWGKLTGEKSWGDFWYDLYEDYVDLTSLSINIDGFATELVTLMIERVFMPDLDPHPEEDGHRVLKQAFVEALSK